MRGDRYLQAQSSQVSSSLSHEWVCQEGPPPGGRSGDGHRADGLWGELGKDRPLSRGGQPHILDTSAHHLLQQNSKDWEGECGRARKSHHPPPPSMIWSLRTSAGQ